MGTNYERNQVGYKPRAKPGEGQTKREERGGQRDKHGGDKLRDNKLE